MKLLTITFLVIGSYLNAQLVLDASDFATSGDAFIVNSSNNLEVDFESTGEDYYWDFLFLTADNQSIVSYSSTSGLPFLLNLVYGPNAQVNYRASYFMDANIPLDLIGDFLPVAIDEVSQYSKLSPDSLTLLGLSMSIDGNGIPARSDTIETRLKFPLAYGNSHFSRGYTKLNMNPILDAQWIQHRTRTTQVDGWGTIKTLHGSYEALRVKHEITESDSFNYQGIWIPIPVPPTVEYEWWGDGQLLPILKISTVLVGGIEQVTAVEFRDEDYLSLEQLELNAIVYPNPVDDVLTLQLEEQVDAIVISDINGRVLLHDKTIELINTYSMEDFESGVYFISIFNSTGSKQLQFVKQ